jgi:hypothetical protein
MIDSSHCELAHISRIKLLDIEKPLLEPELTKALQNRAILLYRVWHQLRCRHIEEEFLDSVVIVSASHGSACLGCSGT